jgi:hypothetical protein
MDQDVRQIVSKLKTHEKAKEVISKSPDIQKDQSTSKLIQGLNRCKVKQHTGVNTSAQESRDKEGRNRLDESGLFLPFLTFSNRSIDLWQIEDLPKRHVTSFHSTVLAASCVSYRPPEPGNHLYLDSSSMGGTIL